jgi:hypothetical protein
LPLLPPSHYRGRRMVNGAAPPCCVRCGEFDPNAGACRLLLAPTLENRRQLLTMPCQVQRLLSQRFHAYGEDVAQDALLLWLSPGWSPEDILRSFRDAPLDARLWLTSWPYFYLGRTAVRRLHEERAQHGQGRAEAPAVAVGDPAAALRVLSALDQVHKIDAVSHAMLLDLVHDRFEPGRWSALLECSEATVTDRKYLSIYRYTAHFHDVLGRISPRAAAVALFARRFSPGEPTDQTALEATRAALGDPELTMSGWRALYREGALQSLALLGAAEALGPETMEQVGTAFRRVLRVD